MMYCKNCGVALEDNMPNCPLCGELVNSHPPAGGIPTPAYGEALHFPYKEMSKPQKKFTWEIVSLIVLLSAITTFIIDFIINRRITWSELPVAICIAIFCYVSLFTFWDNAAMIKIVAGFLLSSGCFIVLDHFTGNIQWAVRLGIPLLFATNLIIAVLIVIIRQEKYKGVNLIAYVLLGAAILCLAIEGSLTYFKTASIQIQWSAIVAASLIPVVIVLLFIHFRLKKGRSLEKTFHV